MSEDLQKELDKYKEYLINEYRSNGGNKDLTDFTLTMIQNEIENQKRVNALRREVEELKRSKSIPKDMPFAAVNQGRENAELAKRLGASVGATLDYMFPPYDPREIDDERLKRDNSVLQFVDKDHGDPRSVVILRDDEGRMA